MLLALALQLAPPTFQKFDRLQAACVIKTEIKSSNGRDSNYTLTMDVAAETEKAEGGATTFDCGVAALRIEGTLDGRKVDAAWSKGGGWKGDGKIAGLDRALEKGWKMTLAAGKGTSIGDGYLELGDLLPVFNPGALLGYSVPPPATPVAAGKTWEVKGQTFPHAGGFGLRAAATFDFAEGDSARLSARLTFGKAETEIPIEGASNVKGDGYASLAYDSKKGRPVKGASSAKLVLSQGGLKREISQVVEFEMR
ncbi:MAG TPA: hypothetical protein VF950_16535 [Planctomycetota bacterium]